ncbi:MAG: HigA family addiction module antidote protein [Deltaproteobacteria bacterium]|nr:HigA family addiction module antidote protein [Deltaproteobacteria bacterium]
MKFQNFPNPFHPGEILLEEFLSPLGLSQRQFSTNLHWSPRKLNEIIKGKRSVTAQSAIDLSEALGTTPEFWLNLQQTWDLAQAYQTRKAS